MKINTSEPVAKEDQLAIIQQAVWDQLPPVQEADSVCPHCHGLGVITIDVEFGHIAFGRAFHCACRREAILTRHLETAVDTLPDDAHTRSWADFDPTSVAKVIKPGDKIKPDYAVEALSFARQLAQLLPAVNERGDEKMGLLMVGPTGCGKSTLASIIYRAWHETDPGAMWLDYLAFIKDVQKGYSDQAVDPEELIRRAKLARRLVLDELGSKTKAERHERVGLTFEDRIEIIRQIINYRWAHQLMTVVTCNLTLTKIYRQFGDLVGSRLVGLCHVVIMAGPDFRTAVVKNRHAERTEE